MDWRLDTPDLCSQTWTFVSISSGHLLVQWFSRVQDPESQMILTMMQTIPASWDSSLVECYSLSTKSNRQRTVCSWAASFETSIFTYQSILRNIAEDLSLLQHHRFRLRFTRCSIRPAPPIMMLQKHPSQRSTYFFLTTFRSLNSKDYISFFIFGVHDPSENSSHPNLGRDPDFENFCLVFHRVIFVVDFKQTVFIWKIEC